MRSAWEAKGEWNATQKKLALDLLGTPKEFRDSPSVLEGDKCARIGEQIARLEAQIAAGMDDLDDLDRADAEVGLGRDLDKPLALVRRYEATCVRRMEEARKQIGKGRPAVPPEAATTLAAAIVKPQPPPTAPVLAPERPESPIATPPKEPVGNRHSRRARRALARRG